MAQFKHISTEEVNTMREGGNIQLVDIRDEQSFREGHIKGAKHLANHTLDDFIREADPDQPVVVYCYHGNSSQPAAAFLFEKGFEDVYSMDGGFELWRGQYPVETAQASD
jgi:thiosulfate sulfurtransferase